MQCDCAQEELLLLEVTDISMTLAEANITDEFLTTTVQTTLMMISAKVVRGKSPLPQQSQVKEINMK